jgi:hypothetical protein
MIDNDFYWYIEYLSEIKWCWELIEVGLIDEKGFIEVKSVKICVRGILHDHLFLRVGLMRWIREVLFVLSKIDVIQDGRRDEFHLRKDGRPKNSRQIIGSAIDQDTCSVLKNLIDSVIDVCSESSGHISL